MIERGLSLEGEPLRKLDFAGAGRLEFFMVPLRGPGRGGRFRRWRVSDARSREALLNGKLIWIHESLSLLSRPMSMYESVITSVIP
jgi:hypothetical protein